MSNVVNNWSARKIDLYRRIYRHLHWTERNYDILDVFSPFRTNFSKRALLFSLVQFNTYVRLSLIPLVESSPTKSSPSPKSVIEIQMYVRTTKYECKPVTLGNYLPNAVQKSLRTLLSCCFPFELRTNFSVSRSRKPFLHHMY